MTFLPCCCRPSTVGAAACALHIQAATGQARRLQADDKQRRTAINEKNLQLIQHLKQLRKERELEKRDKYEQWLEMVAKS